MKVQTNLSCENLLLSGNAYKDILIRNEREDYFQNHIKVIGSFFSDYNYFLPSEINKNVLVSAVFVAGIDKVSGVVNLSGV